MFKKILTPFLAAAALAMAAQTATALDAKLELVAQGLNAPLLLVSPPDGTKRRFILEQSGLIKIMQPDGEINGEPFLNIRGKLIDLLSDFGKQLWYEHTNTVSEMRVSADDPDVADHNYERIISEIDWPQFNHNGH
jgi:hypothetical protein